MFITDYPPVLDYPVGMVQFKRTIKSDYTVFRKMQDNDNYYHKKSKTFSCFIRFFTIFVSEFIVRLNRTILIFTGVPFLAATATI